MARNKNTEHGTEHSAEHVTEGAPIPVTIAIAINGVTFHSPVRYAEGHVLSALEAKTLNQTLAENLRNNFAPKLAKAVKALTPEGAETVPMSEAFLAEQVALFNAYAAEYTFSGPRASRIVADPVEAEAQKIAKQDLVKRIQAKGGNPKDYSKTWFEEKVKEVLAKHPKYMELARQRIAELQNISVDGLDELLGEAA
jgi:hypothetical protein